MSVSREQRHDEVVRQLADRYTARGYAVQLAPVVTVRPGFEVHPDLLARREGETVLVEVKVVGGESPTPVLSAMAEVAQREGWRFVIAVVNPKDVDEIEVPSAAEILSKLAELRTLTPGSAASALLAWAVLESAARLVLARLGRRPNRSTSPQALVQHLASLGLVSLEEERDLLVFAVARNRLAHGFWSSSVDGPQLERVIQVVQKLLAEPQLPGIAEPMV